MCFSKKLKEARESKKLSIRKLAELSNVNASYISRLERGIDSSPGIKIILKLSQALEIPPESLSSGDDLLLIEVFKGIGTKIGEDLISIYEDAINKDYVVDKSSDLQSYINYLDDVFEASYLFTKHNYKLMIDEHKNAIITDTEGKKTTIPNSTFEKKLYDLVDRVRDFERFEIERLIKENNNH